jgi:uncharacterized protein (TIGR02246 family)
MAAQTPRHVHELFAEHFSAGNLEELMALYDPNAVMEQPDGTVLNGREAIRAHLAGFLALECRMNLTVDKVIQNGNLALLLSNWTLTGADTGGDAIESTGRTSDLVQQQADGTWVLLIDNPYGGDGMP